jgi:hypothetical protein
MPKKPSDKTDLRALRNLIKQADLVLTTSPTKLPEGRSERAHELLGAAVKLADDLVATPAAARLGQRGGMKTAKRGADYFRKIAGMRKTHAGGRPRKAES